MREAGLTTATQIGMWAVVSHPNYYYRDDSYIPKFRSTTAGHVRISVYSSMSAVGFWISPLVQRNFGLSIAGLTLAALDVFSAMPIILATPMSYLPAGATAGGLPM